MRYYRYAYNIPPQNNKIPLILERPSLRIYVVLMMIVSCQNPGEESGGVNFWSCFFQVSNACHQLYIFVIWFLRLEARLRRGRAVLYLAFNEFCLFPLSLDLSARCPSFV